MSFKHDYDIAVARARCEYQIEHVRAQGRVFDAQAEIYSARVRAYAQVVAGAFSALTFRESNHYTKRQDQLREVRAKFAALRSRVQAYYAGQP